MRQTIWLVVGEGEPYLRGGRISVLADQTILGRRSDTFDPDIAFDNFLVSRRHCVIGRNNEKGITIADLGSKHGTEVNGQQLTPGSPHILADGDTITLAKGAVTLRLMTSATLDETMELGRMRADKLLQMPLILDEARHECRIGKQTVSISTKEWDFLWLLYQQPGHMVSYDVIKRTVWTERTATPGGAAPDVGMDEINTLIYRLRRKLGSQGDRIRTVRGQGCLLETEDLPKSTIDK